MAKRTGRLDNQPKIRIERMDDVPWKPSDKAGVMQQDVRHDPENGRYFGAARFEPMARSGTHRHLGPAAAYMLSGSVVDYHTEVCAGQVLINMNGAVHDVITYSGALTIARVDGAVLYPGEEGILADLGARARAAGAQVDDTVDMPPNLSATLADIPARPTGIAGVQRRMIYDYAGENWQGRFVELLLRPGATVPRHRTRGLTDWFVLAGAVEVDGRQAESASYVVIEPDTALDVASRYGARVLCWADGPVAWEAGAGPADLYGH